MLRRTCPDPRCRDGFVSYALRRSAHRAVRPCPTCGGSGRVDERDDDLRAAGIVLWDPSDEDFRSSPTHYVP